MTESEPARSGGGVAVEVAPHGRAGRRSSLTDPLGALFRRKSDFSCESADGDMNGSSNSLDLGNSARNLLGLGNNNSSCSNFDASGKCDGGTEASTPTSRPKPIRRASVTDILSNIIVKGGNNPSDRENELEEAVNKIRERKDAEIADLRSETADLRAALNSASLRHQLELEERNRQYRLMKTRLEQMGRDMKDKDSIYEYCKMIKEAAPHRTDTQYVIKLQAQMAKVLHEMGVMGNQLTAMKQGCDGVVASLHADMSKIVHDKSKAEQQFMNDLMVLEEEKRKLKEEYEERLHEKDGEIEALKKKVMALEIRNMVVDSDDEDDDN